MIRDNLLRTVRQIRERSQVVRDLGTAGDLAVVGAVHDLATGRVNWV